jgi:hypothetical protein
MARMRYLAGSAASPVDANIYTSFARQHTYGKLPTLHIREQCHAQQARMRLACNTAEDRPRPSDGQLVAAALDCELES